MVVSGELSRILNLQNVKVLGQIVFISPGVKWSHSPACYGPSYLEHPLRLEANKGEAGRNQPDQIPEDEESET